MGIQIDSEYRSVQVKGIFKDRKGEAMKTTHLTEQELRENEPAQDRANAAFIATMQGTEALALFQQWKQGETICVRTKPLVHHQESRTFEIEPIQFLGFSVGYTLWVNGKPDRQHQWKAISQADFLDWMTTLEAVNGME
jgi:hypothetical protein